MIWCVNLATVQHRTSKKWLTQIGNIISVICDSFKTYNVWHSLLGYKERKKLMTGYIYGDAVLKRVQEESIRYSVDIGNCLTYHKALIMNQVNCHDLVHEV